MSISYNKLWKLMIDNNLNKTELREKANVSTNVIAKMGKNETVSMETLEKICAVFNCEIGDIVEILREED